MSENRRVRVFASSTFRDMVEESDELMTRTWPELRRHCRERKVELVEVDLRWGIAKEQATRKEALKLSLDEIKACRPFFIGLLGERYGWTPGSGASLIERYLHSAMVLQTPEAQVPLYTAQAPVARKSAARFWKLPISRKSPLWEHAFFQEQQEAAGPARIP